MIERIAACRFTRRAGPTTGAFVPCGGLILFVDALLWTKETACVPLENNEMERDRRINTRAPLLSPQMKSADLAAPATVR